MTRSTVRSLIVITGILGVMLFLAVIILVSYMFGYHNGVELAWTRCLPEDHGHPIAQMVFVSGAWWIFIDEKWIDFGSGPASTCISNASCEEIVNGVTWWSAGHSDRWHPVSWKF